MGVTGAIPSGSSAGLLKVLIVGFLESFLCLLRLIQSSHEGALVYRSRLGGLSPENLGEVPCKILMLRRCATRNSVTAHACNKVGEIKNGPPG